MNWEISSNCCGVLRKPELYPTSSKLTCQLFLCVAANFPKHSECIHSAYFNWSTNFLLRIKMCTSAVKIETMRNRRSGLLEFLTASVVICFFPTGILEEFLGLLLAKADSVEIETMRNRQSGHLEFLTDSVVICSFPTGILCWQKQIFLEVCCVIEIYTSELQLLRKQSMALSFISFMNYLMAAIPLVDLYLIFEESSCENKVRRAGFLACKNKF